MAKKKVTDPLTTAIDNCVAYITQNTQQREKLLYEIHEALTPLIDLYKKQCEYITGLQDELEMLENEAEQASEYISELENKKQDKDIVDVLDSLGYPEADDKSNWKEVAMSEYLQVTANTGVGVYVLGKTPLNLQFEIDWFLDRVRQQI